MYVIHLPVVKWLIGRGVTPPLVLAESLAITLLLAALSWVALERPMLAYKTRWPMPGRTDRDRGNCGVTIPALTPVDLSA